MPTPSIQPWWPLLILGNKLGIPKTEARTFPLPSSTEGLGNGSGPTPIPSFAAVAGRTTQHHAAEGGAAHLASWHFGFPEATRLGSESERTLSTETGSGPGSQILCVANRARILVGLVLGVQDRSPTMF